MSLKKCYELDGLAGGKEKCKKSLGKSFSSLTCK